MMKRKYNFTVLIFLLIGPMVIKAQSNPDFTLASNGVTCLCPNANFGDTGTLTINSESKTFTKRTRAQLDSIIDSSYYADDPQIALTCTTGITDMSTLFLSENGFDQNIESWDVSNVTDMRSMFISAGSFNQPLNNWDVSNVTDMRNMFRNAGSFNQPLNNWNVSSVTQMERMFDSAQSFNQPLNNWDVSNVSDMNRMFLKAKDFNQPLSNWDVSNVTSMLYMFSETQSFNGDISGWDISSVTDMNGMFRDASDFNQPLNTWDTSSVTNMFRMFDNAYDFNRPLDNWDVSNVTQMGFMFQSTSFNQDISSWCVEQIQNEPGDFSYGSPLQDDYKPNWGATCTLSIADNSLTNFKVYPNPAQSQLNLSWSSIDFPDEINIEVYSLKGQKILSESYSQKPSELNVGQLASGVYLLKVYSGNQSAVRRIIKK